MSGLFDEAARAAWLVERRSGLGGSDAATAVGVDPYRDQLTLWSEKVGLVEPADLSGNEAVEAGTALEVAIAEWYGRRTGREVTLGVPYQLLRSERHPWMFATLDATQQLDGERAVVQVKNTSFPADAWEEQLPLHYEVQLAHEMLVAGVTRGTLVALHRGQQLRWYDRTLDARLAEAIVTGEERFWQLVVSGQAPEPGPRSADAVRAMFPRDLDAVVVALPHAADELDAELEQIKAQQTHLEDRRSAIESQIKVWIGSHAKGVTPQGVSYSWTGSEVTYKPQEARTAYVRRFRRSVKR